VAAVISVVPIRPGKLDEWRALHADLMGPRRIEWAESQRRRGVTREVVSLVDDSGRALAAIFTEAADPKEAARVLQSSTDAFDRWLVERLDALLEPPLPSSRVIDTAPRKGPWRGWGRWRG
jgi:hypothetical protein